MENHGEKYIPTEWANTFLLENQEQFSNNEERRQFIGTLDKYNIQENEAYTFLEAFQSPNKQEAIEKFLKKRYLKEEEPDIVRSPERSIPPKKAA